MGPRSQETILAVESVDDWRSWLAEQHARSKGVLLRIPKGHVEGRITYAQALDVALAWGWIDSQKRALDASSWLQRFTPRSANSPWSKINREKAEALQAAGRMERPGLAEVERAKRDGRWTRAYVGSRAATVPEDFTAALARSVKARSFFDSLDRANRYAILYRVQAAKTPETRAKRIARFVSMCAKGETIHPRRQPIRK